MAGSPPYASLGLGAFWALFFSKDSPAVNDYLCFTLAVYTRRSNVVHTLSHRLPGLVTVSILWNRSLTHFENRFQSCSFPTLTPFWMKTHSSTSVNSGSGDLGNKALESIREMRSSFAVHESPTLGLPGVPATSCQLCQCPFHPAHTSFEYLCLALMSSSAGWCQPGLVLWGQNVLLEMNGTPGLCSFCRRKCCNHIPFILPFPSIWSFN